MADHLTDIDAKLRTAAERTRANYKAKGALAEDGSAKRDGLLKQFLELVPTDPTATVAPRLPRVDEAEGDRPPASDDQRALLVPARFAAASFDTYQAATQSQRTALAAVERWVQHAKNRTGVMLALIGPTGVGKSHLLYAAANALLSGGYGTYARGWYRLADELRYGGESPMALNRDGRPFPLEASEVRGLLWKQKIVLLDEVRPTASTAFDDTELAKFACHAYDAKLSVLITTNVHPLSDVMGPPAASRFTQLVVDGQDRRQA